MRVVNLSSAVISTPVPVETAEKHSCLTRLQSTLFNAVRISAVNSIIIGCLLADVPSAVYRNEEMREIFPNSIESEFLKTEINRRSLIQLIPIKNKEF